MSSTCIHEAQLSKLTLPTLSSRIYKDECTLCFEDATSYNGLNVCLVCFNGSCESNGHTEMHFHHTGHALMLHLKKEPASVCCTDEANEPKTKSPKLSSKLESFIRCVACDQVLLDVGWEQRGTASTCSSSVSEEQSSLDQMSAVALAVLADSTKSSKEKYELDTMQASGGLIEICEHSMSLESVACANSNSAVPTQCSKCEVSENLWMCLVCASVNCGRKQYDGTGGNGHGLIHHQETGHACALRLGTIKAVDSDDTSKLTADVHCYLCDELRVVPNLSVLLSRFGLSVHEQGVQCAQTMAEMQLAENMKLNLEDTDNAVGSLDQQQAVIVQAAPGRVGLCNLGNSCYMSSVLQLLIHQNAFDQVFGIDAHVESCRRDPASCVSCQLSKLTVALMKQSEHAPVAPWMFKRIVTMGHAEFSTDRQQDAAEFLGFLFRSLQRSDPTNANEILSKYSLVTGQKFKCASCSNESSHLRNPIAHVLDVSLASTAVELGEGSEISMDQLMQAHFGEEVVQRSESCSVCGQSTWLKQMELLQLPKEQLLVTVGKCTLRNWVPVKMNIGVTVSNQLDLSSFCCASNRSAYESSVQNSPDLTQPAFDQAEEQTIDPEHLVMLQSMGFTQERSRRALLACAGQGLEAATTWLFEHMDDNDNGSVDCPGQPSQFEDEASVQMLVDAGFDASRARQALQACESNVERAFDWLLSHSTEQLNSSAVIPVDALDTDEPMGDARFQLVGFISHRGSSMHCGHYVVYIKDVTNGVWLCFNDSKVSQLSDVQLTEPMKLAVVYLFDRL